MIRQEFTANVDRSEELNFSVYSCLRCNRSSRATVLSPKVMSPETRVVSREILIKSVCNISRSLSDSETKQAGQLCNKVETKC